MQQRKRYPIGIQTFSKIREGNYLYIDKTEYVYRMTHSGPKSVFLNRPRRFGKSLLTSTLHSYFEGRKELFEGLAIAELEAEWISYPVLHFDMSTAKHVDREQLEQELNLKLLRYEEIYGKGEGEISANLRLQGLIGRAYAQTGRQVVVLIDEYDAPLLDVIHEEKNLPELRNVMRNFYSPLKACDPYLHFVFLTGITRFFPSRELNNIDNISMDEPYAAICGISEEEMLTQMSTDLDLLATRMKLTREEVLEKLKEHYDGYHFTAVTRPIQSLQPAECFCRWPDELLLVRQRHACLSDRNAEQVWRCSPTDRRTEGICHSFRRPYGTDDKHHSPTLPERLHHHQGL